MNLTPERKAEQKIAARWGANVARLLKEKGLKACDLGRLLNPEANNPTSTVFMLTRRHTMPDDKTQCAVASFLGVSKEALHAGELPDLPGDVKARTESQARRAGCTDAEAARIAERTVAHRVAPSASERRAPTPARNRTTKSHADTVEPQAAEPDDVIQRFVLFALKRKLKALDAGARYALLSDVARLCIDEG